jgi:beta-ureidopropionase
MARNVWIATTAFHHAGGPDRQANIARAAALIDVAAAHRPDLICLPETFPSMGVAYGHIREVAEPVPGPTTEMAMAKAAEIGANVICPINELRGDTILNTAVVIDRSGAIVGKYDKRHPVTTAADFTAMEQGTMPGSGPAIFDLDFGRIGVRICFDIQWPGDWVGLARDGAEVIVWCSAYDGGFALQSLAWQMSRYVVSAVLSHHAAVIDMTGEVLARTEAPQAVLVQQINLDKRLFHTDFNAPQIPAIRRKYGRDVLIRRCHPEGVMTVESLRDGLSVDDLAAEFDLESVPDYVARHDRAHADLLAGREPEPQPPRRTAAQWTSEP